MSGKWLGIAVKAVVSIALIWFLLDRVDAEKVLVRARALELLAGGLALATLAVQIGLVAGRWWLIARLIASPLRVRAALRIVMIGLFFNQTLPSSVGGDAVRIWLMIRQGAPLGKAVNSVLSDRVLGFVVLVAVIGVSLPLVYTRMDDSVTRTMLTTIVVAGAAGLTLFLCFAQKAAVFLSRGRYTRPFGVLAADFHQLLVQGWLTAAIVGLSAVTHLLSIAAIVFLASGLGLALGFLDCLVVVPTVLLVSTIPVSIAGWGVREGAMVAGFGLLGLGADDALALSILYGLAQIVVSLPGGVVWLVSRPRASPGVEIGAARPQI